MIDRRSDDATALLDRIASGELTAAEAVAAAVQRCEAHDPQLHAVIHRRAEAAMDEAASLSPSRRAGPLGGLPIVVKDLGCEQQGEPHHHGARFLRDLDWRGTEDSYLWRTLRDAGAISLGRTNTPEFGSTITTEPAAYGPTHNPWSLDHSPGGSSGGSAAAVAAGIVTMAHGNDGGGSIRIPAAACGLVGLKATRGRVSTGPHAGEHRGGFAVDGMLTRTVRDAALALEVIARPWAGDPIPSAPPANWRAELAASRARPGARLRIAAIHGRSDPTCRAAVDRTVALLDDLGHEIVDCEPPPGWFDPEVTDQAIVVRTVGMARELDSWAAKIGRPLTEDDVEASNWWSAEIGRTLTGTMYAAARAWLDGWARQAAGWFTDVDMLVTPVLGGPTPPLGHLSDPIEGPARLRELIGFVDQANVSGQPAISVPTGVDGDGLPIGVQLLAGHRREHDLLRVAAELEDADAFLTLPELAERW